MIINKEKTKSLAVSLIVILMVVVGFYVFMQKQPNYVPGNDISYLNTIYSENQNQKSNYFSRVIPVDSATTEGGEIVVYFDKDTGDTKIIEASYAGETFKREYTYYLSDINNFILLERDQQWDRPFYVEGRQKSKDEITKYYFRNLNMIQWVDSQSKIVDFQSEKFKEKEKEILLQLDNFLNVIKQ